MLKSFRVYFKNGEILTFKFLRFEYDEEQFIIYDSKDSAASDAFLSFKPVAAIIPVEQQENEYWYTVYLKSGNSFEVSADRFIMGDKINVSFFWENTPQPDVEVDNIYVARSEVVAIIPSEGLERPL
jgi:hypothetical protein